MTQIMKGFGPKELCVIVEVMEKMLVEPGENRAAKWSDQIMPFSRFTWPDGPRYRDEQLSLALASLCIKSKEMFGIVFEEVQYGISDILFPDAVFKNLEENGLCSNFPDAALGLMATIVGPNTRILLPEMYEACLKTIEQTKPSLVSSKKFRDLHARI